MSLRVQCDHCGAIMNVRDDYAGTRRRCPKCKQKFDVPEVGLPDDDSDAEVGGAASGHDTPGEVDDFDPVAFLSGDAPASATGSPSRPKPPKTPPPEEPADFDPLDVLNDGPSTGSGNVHRTAPASSSKSSNRGDSTKGAAKQPKGTSHKPAPSKPAPAVEEPEFDPLDVLGDGPTPPTPITPTTKPSPASPTAASPPAVAPSTAAKEVTPPASEAEETANETPSTAAPVVEPPASGSAEPAAPAELPKLPARSKTIDEPVAEILPEGTDLPKYRRPVKRSTPVEELPDEDFDNAGRPQPKATPKRPSWAKPSAEEPPPATPVAETGSTAKSPTPPAPPTDVSTTGPPPPGVKSSQPKLTADPKTAGTGSYERVDASPAAAAAAAAVGGVAAESKKPPVDDEPDDPIVDVAEIKASLKRRKYFLAGGVVSALLLYFIFSWFVNSGFYSDPPRWPPCLPVTGRVVRGGEPIAGARVIFHNASKNLRTPEAITDSDGRYTLQLVNGIPGGPEGRFVVQVEHIAGNHDDIPTRFGSRSTLTRVIAKEYIKEGSVVIDIDVAPPK